MKIEIADDVVWRDLGGEIVILNLATQHYFGLTGAGNDMWRLIAEHGSSDKIIDDLTDSYDNVDAGKLRGEFEELVRELAEKGMVRISSDDNV
jgi:hypothetical protein